MIRLTSIHAIPPNNIFRFYYNTLAQEDLKNNNNEIRNDFTDTTAPPYTDAVVKK